MRVVVQTGEEEVGAGVGSQTHHESRQEPGKADLENRGESRILPVSPAFGKAECLTESRAVWLRRWGVVCEDGQGGMPSPGHLAGISPA